ncbi:hypothetical protein [Cupriavidus sp. PET2-C1]
MQPAYGGAIQPQDFMQHLVGMLPGSAAGKSCLALRVAYHALAETAVTQRFREGLEAPAEKAPVAGREAVRRSGGKQTG